MMIALCLLMITVMLAMPGVTTAAARDALRVWGFDVAPSLFPYMVLCRMIALRLRRSGFPAAPAAALLGLMGGSPSGAAVISVYGSAGAIGRRQIWMLCAFTGTISPMFLLSTTAVWIGDAALCRLLLAAHIAGAATAALVVRLAVPPDRPTGSLPCKGRVQTEEGDPIAQSVHGILGVGGCIVFFSVLASAAGALTPRTSPLPGAIVHAALEIAGGMHTLCAVPLPPMPRAVLMAAASGFSGLSILTQNLVFLRPLGIGMAQLIGFGLLRAVGAGAAMICLLTLFG